MRIARLGCMLMPICGGMRLTLIWCRDGPGDTFLETFKVGAD